MKLQRRQFLQMALGATTLGASSRTWAQAYPARPVRFVVAAAPGTAPDIHARLIAQWLTERFGQSFVIDNRPGGAANIGTEAVVRAPADGYTLLLVTTANAINATLFDRLNFNFLHDIAPVAGISRQSLLMVVHPSFPAKTVPEFTAYARANPGTITMASAGIGSSPHLAGELFKTMTGIDMIHVPYRGGAAALTDLLGGQVRMMFGSMAASLDYIRSGKLHAIAVTTPKRLAVLPDIPSVGEFVPGYEATGLFGIGVPRNTPAEIVETLNREINVGLIDPMVRSRLAELDGTEVSGSPAEFGAVIAKETEKWAKVIRLAGIKPQ
jgi:tripartite-type tricarboxylate transporter receptor subunit TctC